MNSTSFDAPQIALVTGSGRGIGAATARLLALRGYHVCINFRHDERSAWKLADELEKLVPSSMDTSSDNAPRIKPLVVQADVSRETEVVRLFDTIDREPGTLAALVNNAAVLSRQMCVKEMNAERINHILTNNVTSAFLCAREAIKRMSTASGGTGGSIVNVSSAAARTGSPGEYVDYAASKGALDTLTRGLAHEVAAEGIRVNAVRPGFIFTDMHADGGDPERVERLSPQIPMQRGGSAEEVAHAIAWLLSEEASYVTGSFIDAAGGR